MKEALVIGRFQLVGNQHADLFKQVKEYGDEHGISRINVGIGVANTIDAKNPFSATECLEMVKPVVERIGIDSSYYLVPDINDSLNYAEHVKGIMGIDLENIVLFSSNQYTNSCFRDKCEVIETPERITQHSTELRRLVANGNDISDLVPDHIPRYLKMHDAKKRLAKLTYDNPIPTVDIVIRYKEGIVIIKRNEEPIGYALPGGHIDYGETAETAAIREAKEETGLDVKLTELIGVFSDPNRDPRGHKITIAYEGIGHGKLKAGSDAKEVGVLKNPTNLVLGHDKILYEHTLLASNKYKER